MIPSVSVTVPAVQQSAIPSDARFAPPYVIFAEAGSENKVKSKHSSSISGSGALLFSFVYLMFDRLFSEQFNIRGTIPHL
jgi:hypothetical protein